MKLPLENFYERVLFCELVVLKLVGSEFFSSQDIFLGISCKF